MLHITMMNGTLTLLWLLPGKCKRKNSIEQVHWLKFFFIFLNHSVHSKLKYYRVCSLKYNNKNIIKKTTKRFHYT